MAEMTYVSVRELASQLGMDRSHARRYILKAGYAPRKRRTPDSGNQLALTVSSEEAEAILASRREQGFLESAKAVTNEHGVFYVAQLIPDCNPNRVKVGFAIDMQERMTQHHTAAPTAKCLRTWPCRRSWELAVIASLTRTGCQLISNEVFECEECDELIARGDAFFSVMPDPNWTIPLAAASLLRKATSEGK